MSLLVAACGDPPVAPAPDFGSDVRASPAPPPITGGTLLVTSDGSRAIAADPDRDRIFVVDLAHRRLRAEIPLAAGEQPFRAAEDAAGRVHVVLRGAGALVTVDPTSGLALFRRAVCPEPRGLAYDARTDVVHVACAGGELVTLPASGGAPTRVVRLDGDLRDVVLDGRRLLVSRFRSAQLLEITDDGSVAAQMTPPTVVETRTRFVGRRSEQVSVRFSPDLAWRAVPIAGGGVAMVHQLAQLDPIDLSMGYWNIACSDCSCSIVETALSLFGDAAPERVPVLPTAVLPVDLALSRDGRRAAVIAAGNATVTQYPQLLVYGTDSLRNPSQCVLADASVRQPSGQATAVAFDTTGHPIVQTREPAALFFPDDGSTLSLSAVSRADTGETVFHANSGRFVACASCHAEGAEDGHVWTFSDTGPRRTQSLRGGLLSTAPFHWDGHLADMRALVDETFVQRMGGPSLLDTQVAALGHWLDAQPTFRPSVGDAAAVERGRVLFNDPAVGCNGCHSGPHNTNDANVSVGTGGIFQVPSLRGVAFRAPYMHDGCAATLRDRFGPCGGRDRHGHTSQLSDAQIADLVAYLESL